MLRPRKTWPEREEIRWYSSWSPEWLKVPLRVVWPDRRRRTLDELARDLEKALRTPGYQIAIAPPIRTRIDMLTTGVRTPVGIKVFGPDLAGIERLSIELEGLLRQISGTRSTFAERQTGREYVDITPNRQAIARYGLTVRDVNDIVEAAIGGMPVSTVIAGRSRFSVNLRYGADYRSDPEALRKILVPVASSGSVAEPEIGSAGVGVSSTVNTMGGPGTNAANGMGAMGGSTLARSGASMTEARAMQDAAPMGSAFQETDTAERWRQPAATVPLGTLADVQVVTGPPMIKDENGMLVGYVFADIDLAQRDLGGWVTDAKQLVVRNLEVPASYRLQWTGQYEFMAEMESRMRFVLPLTFVLIVALLYLAMKGWPQTLLVLLSLPFAVAGSVWLLAALHYNLSTAVWVGLIAVGGVAAETGIVMVVYLDEAFERHRQDGRIRVPADVDVAVIEGASTRVRPLVMTVATTVLGLLPLLWESGVGADVSARTAAPVVGGLWSCMFLTLLVLPAAYSIWRRFQVRTAGVAVFSANRGSTTADPKPVPVGET